MTGRRMPWSKGGWTGPPQTPYCFQRVESGGGTDRLGMWDAVSHLGREGVRTRLSSRVRGEKRRQRGGKVPGWVMDAERPPLPAAREAPPRSSAAAPPRPAERRCSARGGEAERPERTRRPGRPHPAAAGERKRAPALLPSLHPGTPRPFSAPETKHLPSASASAELPPSEHAPPLPPRECTSPSRRPP